MSELKNTFSWSVSRHRVFSECPRQYYYRHYGSWGGWNREAEPAVREAYILKQLGNRFTLAGKIVHEVVADTLNRHRYGREVERGEAQAQALQLLREGFRESRDGAYRERPREAVGLFEHEYREEIPDREWQRIRDRVFKCLDHFFESKIRATILETRIENWLPVDALDSFLFDEVTVYVAPDFAIRNRQGNALVIDWKTGRPSAGGEDRIQIVCYGLFARAKWGIEAERAIGELHYLLTDDVDIITLDDRTLEEGTRHIRDSIAAMQERLVDVAENRAVMEDFPQVEDRELCRRCNYRKLCWPAWPETGSPGGAEVVPDPGP
jgi:CRISPR/Cas system-associated exonuclease Cas4 (RecB family)